VLKGCLRDKKEPTERTKSSTCGLSDCAIRVLFCQIGVLQFDGITSKKILLFNNLHDSNGDVERNNC